MPCYNPLWAIPKKDGTYDIIPRFFVQDGSYDDEFTFKNLTKIGKCVSKEKLIRVPCGHCLGCRLDYSRQWANRCVLESKCYPEDESSFLTLTYDDYHLTYDDESGVPSLNPKELQDFIKRLREKVKREYNKNIRFYACGEYGDEDNRPHFHVLLFGFEFPDLRYRGKGNGGDPLYSSKFLDGIWNRGMCWIGACTWKTCAYTARYVMKKQKGRNSKQYYQERGIAPEFVRMSLRPGIGAPYFEKHKEKIYLNDEVMVPNGDKVIIAKPPPYFDRLMSRENPALIESIKKLRTEYNQEFNSIQVELAQTDLDEAGYFELKAREKQNASKSLKRTLKGCTEL